MVNNVIQNIKEKFIENLDAGLMLADDFNTGFAHFEESLVWAKELSLNSGNHFEYYAWRWERLNEEDKLRYDSFWSHFKPEIQDITKPTITKQNVIQYLILKQIVEEGKYVTQEKGRFSRNFLEAFKNFWTPKTAILQSILAKAPDYLMHENINATDKVVINVGYRSFGYQRNGKVLDKFEVINKGKQYSFNKESDCKGINATFADIFVVNNKYFIKLSLGENGVIDRTENIISRDIKKLNIVQGNLLEIYFHGHYDPETIVLDDYGEALNLQRHLTELRDKRNHHDGKRN